jgi:hypothetical protein
MINMLLVAAPAYARVPVSCKPTMEVPPMPPIRLSDSELDAVLAAARPLDVRMRDAFLQRVASELGRCGELGPGVVHRVCAEVQREYFDPPQFATGASGRTGKYR